MPHKFINMKREWMIFWIALQIHENRSNLETDTKNIRNRKNNDIDFKDQKKSCDDRMV